MVWFNIYREMLLGVSEMYSELCQTFKMVCQDSQYLSKSPAKCFVRKCTAQKMNFSIRNFVRKCDQIRSFMQIWPHLLKKFLMGNFIFLCIDTYENSCKFQRKATAKITFLPRELRCWYSSKNLWKFFRRTPSKTYFITMQCLIQ